MTSTTMPAVTKAQYKEISDSNDALIRRTSQRLPPGEDNRYFFVHFDEISGKVTLRGPSTVFTFNQHQRHTESERFIPKIELTQENGMNFFLQSVQSQKIVVTDSDPVYLSDAQKVSGYEKGGKHDIIDDCNTLRKFTQVNTLNQNDYSFADIASTNKANCVTLITLESGAKMKFAGKSFCSLLTALERDNDCFFLEKPIHNDPSSFAEDNDQPFPVTIPSVRVLTEGHQMSQATSHILRSEVGLLPPRRDSSVEVADKGSFMTASDTDVEALSRLDEFMKNFTDKIRQINLT